MFFGIKDRLQVHLKRCNHELDDVMLAIAAEIAQHLEIQARFELVQPNKGIGKRVATAIVGGLPELGHLNRCQNAAIAGVATIARYSGKICGSRLIVAGRKWLSSQLTWPSSSLG